ncbi:MAG: glycoside hydrolase [Dehalococcoidia bacterium]|nr:glycoside hydrolase [Dehalococcoidia bacterium]
MVGEGFGDESARLRELSTSLKNSCKIVQVGWVEPHDLPGYYAMADLAIYPMDDTIINRAKCPAKLVELLSASVPVVADRVGQVSEYIVNGESGITVEPGDTSAFAREILRLLRDDTLRRTLGRGGKARVEATFRWDHLVKAVEEAYAP